MNAQTPLRRWLTQFFIFAIGLYASLASAQLPEQSRVPGGVAHVRVGNASERAPSVFVGDQRAWVVAQKKEWLAIVGIPLTTKPGEFKFRVQRGEISHDETITVKAKKYPTQRLKLNPAMVDPPADVQARIAKEQTHLAHVRSTWHDDANTSAALQIPSSGRLSSRYGVARVLNGKPRASHAGLDVAIATGTPIYAPGEGVVLDAGDYYYCGKTMFIDHGNGLITMHCHLSEFVAAVGARVKQRELIAKSGATGRATGPHLHWSVYLNGTSVDPELFIAKAQRQRD